VNRVSRGSIWKLLSGKDNTIPGEIGFDPPFFSPCCAIRQLRGDRRKCILPEGLSDLVCVTAQIQLPGDIPQAAEPHYFGNRPSDFIDLTIDHQCVELISQLPRRPVLAVVGNRPVQFDFASWLTPVNQNLKVAGLREIMHRELREHRLRPDDLDRA
jgi:hypothetical protein